MTDEDAELEALRQRRLAELRRLAEARLRAPDATGVVHEVTDATFPDFVRRNRVALVDFWAPWCGPCRAVAPIVATLARDYQGKAAFAKLNTDENPATSRAFEVRSIPFLVVFRDGEAVDGVLGAQPKGAIEAALRPYV